ncbi:MAG: PhoH family protein [Crocinitomicaceae bacterium]|nr:PhoH family protein [Crocinitomicaceae bacterium]
MLERKIEIKGINPAELFGTNNVKLKHIKSFFPKMKIVARGNVVTIAGDEEIMDVFERKFDLILRHFNKFNNLTENNIDNLMMDDGPKMLSSDNGSEILVHGNHGAKIKAKTINQRKLVEAVNKNDMVFAVGPAGTGKTYTAVALAVRALKAKEVKRIILTRPAVEAGENLGFLPGDLKEKLDPYLMPLYDALRDMIPAEKLADMIEFGIIEIAPLAFMRGRTLDKAFVILDEAQNTTTMQMKMFLTRMGMTAKFAVTGDMTQVDLPRKQQSGLAYAINALDGVEGIGVIRMGQADVIRHKLIKKIITAFEQADEVEGKEHKRNDSQG